MGFLAPLALLLGLLSIPIILMYMLRLRRREMRVSSTLLWQTFMRDREANAPWQKLRRNLLLLLQLLILAALVLALARPYFTTPALINGNLVILLDGSASMQATDGTPTRFNDAQQAANRLIGGLSGDAQMTIILAGQTPRVLAAAASDRAALRDAVASAEPDNAPADWPAALALVSGAVQGFSEANVVLLSDGGVPADLPPVSAEVSYEPMGSSGENLALSALATRSSDSGPQLFASVTNSGTQSQSTLVTLELDGALYDSRRLTIPPGESRSAAWSIPATSAEISAALTNQTNDQLPVDDQAWAVNAASVNTTALLVSEGNLFLEQLLRVLPGISAVVAPPDSPLINEPYDLVIFDGVAIPEPPPAADLLVINPPIGSNGGLLTVTEPFSDTVAIRIADSPLLEFVDWRAVNIREAQTVSAPWADVLVEAAGGPLLLTGEQNGHRIAVLTFDLRQSDLPLQIAFPILMANITSWLSPGSSFDAADGLRPGEPITITPGPTSTAVTIVKPDGTSWSQAVGDTPTIFSETQQLGLYRVFLDDTLGQQPAGSFAVNLFAPSESAIAPQETVALGTSDGVGESAVAQVGQREWWPWLALLALIILTAEWWIYFRGTKRPKLTLS